MSSPLSAKVDALVERLTTKVALPTRVTASLEEAAAAVLSADRMAAQQHLAAAADERMLVRGADRNNGTVLLIPIPRPFSTRFPDPVTSNHGHEPHLTVLYVSPEMTPGAASKVLHLTRQVAKTIPPFRLFVDAQGGLQTFGDGSEGEKAMWLAARSDPRGELERLHRVLKMTLEREGVEVSAHDSFVPHVTWSYVPNDISDDDVRKMDQRISDRFDRGFWFNVNHLLLSMPNGSVKAIALSPLPRSSVY